MNLIPPIYNYVFFPYRKRRINVITNLKTRRDAEAKLLAGQITPEDFLLAMSYHNEFQVQILQQKNKEDSSEDEQGIPKRAIPNVILVQEYQPGITDGVSNKHLVEMDKARGIRAMQRKEARATFQNSGIRRF